MSYIGSKPANKPVVASDLDPAVITGQTALAVAPADTDEFLISDGGVLKRLDASLIGGGKINQVISTNVSADSMFSTSSTSYVDVTSATVSITPSAASSKIFHSLTFWQGKAALNTTWYRIINTPSGGSAAIIDGTGTSENETWGGSTSGSYLDYDFATNTWNYLHTTNSTVAQVYKLQMRVDSSTSYINRVGAGTTRAATFNWTVMEVLA